MRDVLALIVCGDRIIEVTTATLGPLPLDQPPNSKPVTPYGVITADDTHRARHRHDRISDQQRYLASNTADGHWIPAGHCAAPGMRKPLRALAVAEDAPAGVRPAGSGPVSMARASPEMRPGSHHVSWAATPRAAHQPH